MKKGIVIILIVLMITACGNKSNSSNQESKAQDTVDISVDSVNYAVKNVQEFSYEVPDNWTENNSTDTESFFYPEDGMLMVQYSNMDGLSIGDKTVQKDWTSGLSQSFKSFKLNESNDTTILDHKAFIIKATFEMEDNLYNVVITTFDSNEGVISFLFATLTSSKYSYDAIYDYIISSIKENESINTDMLINMNLPEALNMLDSLGYTATYVHAYSGSDYTNELSAYTREELEKWVILSADIIDANKKIVQLTINTSENIASDQADQAAQKTLISKLDPNNAWQAAEDYGKTQYPYGFELHWMMGQLAQEAQDENTWFLKAYATITNEYGTEYETVCEAHVTGTTNSPEISSFYVY